MEAGEILVYCLCFAFGIGLFVPLYEQIIAINTTTWTFAGHETVAALLPAVPYIYLMSMIGVPLGAIIKRNHQ